MTLSRRIISSIAAILLATSLLPASALAEAIQSTSSPMVAEDTTADDAAIVDEGSFEGQADVASEPQSEPLGKQTGEDADAAAMTGAVELLEVGDTTIAGNLADIEYVFIEADEVSASDAQCILVGFDEDAVAASALDLRRSTIAMQGEDGTQLSRAASGATESAALFEFEGGSLPEGRYSAVRVTVASADALVSYDLTADACDYGFAVVGGNGISIEGAIAEGGIFAIDDNGDVTESRTIEGALQVAGTPNGDEPADGYVLQSTMVILLDPGHGGTDPGASANGLVEKDINLKIALACRNELSQYNGVTVRMTREGDDTVDLATRAEMARSFGANVIIGIHNDSAAPTAHGSSVIIPLVGIEHEVGDALGKQILAQLSKLGLYNRGTWGKAGPEGDYYFMIREPKKDGIPGIIIEHAFLTNAEDAGFLANDANLSAIGSADALAIANYFGLERDDLIYHAPVFDADYYLANNSDVAAACKGNSIAALNHFLVYGMSEGRKGNAKFDVVSYYNRYSDLRSAFGLSLREYYIHYIEHGRFEGRITSGQDKLTEYAAVYNGRDYSSVYDGSFYRDRYKDLNAAFTRKIGVAKVFSDTELLGHFVNHGAGEGRLASTKFSIEGYYHGNFDLRRAFGLDLAKYYAHYVEYGKREGRSIAQDQQMTVFEARSGNVDYSPVYDGSYYWKSHSDLRAHFQRKIGDFLLIDDRALLDHFKNCGMQEGRRATRSFELECYYKSNPDLRRAFGTTDWSKYYMHYIEYGSNEGRVACDSNEMISDAYSAIMGNSQVTPSQMAVRYMQSRKPYPNDVYAQYGAPSIYDFCNIVYQEANAEGVRAEIVFAQAMHETGWLQFGNDVAPEQCNFAGIGATGGVPGNSFNDHGSDSVRIGIRAQVQHLKAYASTDKLKNPCVDPRFDLVKRGCAPSVYDLSGKWATGAGYGDKIMALVDSIIAI